MERERMGLGSCIISGFLVLLALALLIQLVFYGLAKVESRKLQAKLDILKAEGMPVTWTDLAAVPQPAATNGATYYLEADAALKFKADEENMLADVPKLALEGKLDAKQLAQVNTILARNSKALKLIAKGNQQPRTVFPINWEDAMKVSFAHLTKLRRLARVQAAQTVALAAEDKPDAAMASFKEGVKLEAASSEERTLITQMVRIAIQQIALRSLEASLKLSTPSKSALKQAYDSLGETGELEGMVRAFEGERAFGLASFKDIRSGKLDLKELQGMEFDSPGWLSSIFRPSSFSPTGWLFAKDENYYLDVMGAQIEQIQKYVENPVQAPSPADQPEREAPWFAILTRIIMPVYSRAVDKGLDTLAHINCARVALAALAYRQETGQLPGSAAQIEARLGWDLPDDPATGEPLKLVKQGDELVIQSQRTVESRTPSQPPEHRTPDGRPLKPVEEPIIFSVPAR